MFFERFREAVGRLPAGLIRPGPRAPAADIAAAEAQLGILLPRPFTSFLESFDGVDLFHEAVTVGGTGPHALRLLSDMNTRRPPTEPVFAEAAGGDRFAFDGAGRVIRVRAESEERWLAGGDFSRWLDGVVAYHRVLYGPDGEFAPDAFEPDGVEVTPAVALKQTERALRFCPESAEWHHERGVALRRLGRLAEAKEAFESATAADPENPWPRFDLGRAALELGPAFAGEAGAAFEAAALLDRAEAAGRLWVWAARAAQLEAAPERLAVCRREALVCQPGLLEQLRGVRDGARLEGDDGDLAEAEALLAALEGPIHTARVRLAIIRDGEDSAGISAAPAAPAHRTPPPAPRRPNPAGRRLPGGPRRGRSR